MRVVWISLLIGSISCFPPQGVNGGGKPMWWYSSSPSEQAPSQSAYEKAAGQLSESVGYSGYPGQSRGSVGYSGYPGQTSGPVGYSGYQGQSRGSVGYSGYPGQSSGSMGYSGYPGQSSGPVGYSGGTNTGVGSGSYGGQSVPQVSRYGSSASSGPYQQVESWSSSSDTSGENEPVFTTVEDKDQVYAFKSRSRYNRKRLLFDQFRYTPTEPLHPEKPLFPPHRPGRRHHHQKDYVKRY